MATSDRELTQRLWAIAAQLRDRGEEWDPLAITRAAVARNLHPSWAHLSTLLRSRRLTDFMPVPEPVVDFIVELHAGRRLRHLLDPWVHNPRLVAELATRLEPETTLAVAPTLEPSKLSKLMGAPGSIEWRHEDPNARLPIGGEPAPDLVATFPPWFGSRTERRTLQTDGGPLEVSDSPDCLVLLQAALEVAPDGMTAAIVKPAFFLRGSPRSVRSSLEACGLCLLAALHLPPGSFLPATGIGGYLVLIAREPMERMFVAELSADVRIDTLVSNFRKRKNGKVSALGRWVEREPFVSYTNLLTQERLEHLVRRAGLTPRRLSEMVTSVYRHRSGEDPGFDDHGNSLFLPTIGTSSAVLSPSDFKIQPQNYVQLVLDPEQVEASYLARFFDTEMGRLVRTAASTGTTIPKVSRVGLDAAWVALPPSDVRADQIALAAKASSLRSALADIERRIWDEPRCLPELKRTLRHLGREDLLTLWADELPFPLSSIYWRYRATKDAREREEHLLHFFEATSAYMVLIMLSAMAAEPATFVEDRAQIFEDVDRGRLELPSFGTWLRLLGQLAKSTRRKLSSDAEDRQALLHAYRLRSPMLLEPILNKDILTCLEQVLTWRNEWKGHGGVESKAEAKRRVEALGGRLEDLRAALGDALGSWTLVAPVSARYSEGVYSNTVKALMGPNNLFREELLQTTVPLDESMLYLVEEGSMVPLELLPLIRMMSGPESEPGACYFYNRFGKDGVRWISYHYAERSEVRSEGRSIDVAFSKLFDAL